MKTVRAALALALMAGLTVPAWAQELDIELNIPETKLVSILSQEAVDALWCSSVFLEESFKLGYDDVTGYHYDALSFELEISGGDEMEAAGLRDIEQEEIWSIFDEGAYTLSEDDPTGFIEEVAECEARFGDLVPMPEGDMGGPSLPAPRPEGASALFDDALWCTAVFESDLRALVADEAFQELIDAARSALDAEGEAAGISADEIAALVAEETGFARWFLEADIEGFMDEVDFCEATFAPSADG